MFRSSWSQCRVNSTFQYTSLSYISMQEGKKKKEKNLFQSFPLSFALGLKGEEKVLKVFVFSCASEGKNDEMYKFPSQLPTGKLCVLRWESSSFARRLSFHTNFSFFLPHTPRALSSCRFRVFGLFSFFPHHLKTFLCFCSSVTPSISERTINEHLSHPQIVV